MATSKLALCGVLGAQALTASLVTIANKQTLNALAAPALLLFLQNIISLIGFDILALIGKGPQILSSQERYAVIKANTPLAALNMVALVLKTTCLQYVAASVYQIVRGLLIPFTVLLSFFMLGSKPGAISAAGLGVICIGFLVGTSPSALLASSGFGVTMGVVSSFSTALYIVVMKVVTKRKLSSGVEATPLSVLTIAYYNTILTTIALLPAVLAIEYDSLKSVALDWAGHADFLKCTLYSGVLSMALILLTISQVKLTSPTAHMVSASVRGVAQSGLALVVFPKEAKTFGFMLILSTLFIVLGGGIFAIGEARSKKAAAPKYEPLTTVEPVEMNEKPSNGHAHEYKS